MLEGVRGVANSPHKHRVLIAGDSAEAIAAVHALMRDARDLIVETRVMDGRQPDPLYGIAQLPDLLLLRVGDGSVRELEALANYQAAERPPLIVIGDMNHPGCMRAAMQAGARDFLAEPVPQRELLDTIARLASEQKMATASDQCELTAFVNGKGGSGATFLACSIAHLFAEVSQLRTVLLDLDVQFGSLSGYLDVEPKRGLLEALNVADDLDGAAIEAYLSRHDSGLSLLANARDGALVQQELMADRFDVLLNLLLANFERCVVDLPRNVEPFSVHVLERADQIVLVVQQSVPSLHDAARMYDLMTRSLGILPDRIKIVVNRYQRSAAVELADIQSHFPDQSVTCIPNDHRAVSESIDTGIPIFRSARRSAVTKALTELERQLGGRIAQPEKSFFQSFRRTG
jgi:pilus assembly protein CpaE